MPTIYQEIVVRAPCERCFDLARSVEFHVASSREIAARVEGGRRSGLSGEGDRTVWSARFGGFRFVMSTQVENCVYPVSFRDRLTAGLLRRFEHTYRFQPLDEGGCKVSDELLVEAPLPPLGRIVEWAYLRPRMTYLVRTRLEAIKRAAESDEWRRYLPV